MSLEKTSDRRALWLIWLLYFSALIFFILKGLRLTGGSFNYVLDDAFIHLAIAKNLVTTGVWGIRPDEYAPASSSLLWTFLLVGCMKIGGIKIIYPLIINVLCGTTVCWLWWSVGRKFLRGGVLLGWLLVTFYFSILAPISLVGMEHVLQILLDSLFFCLVVGWFDGGRMRIFWLVFLAFLVSAVRYEGVFLVGAAALIFLIKNKLWREAILILAAAALPILAFGWFSIEQGGFFLPNPLIAKTRAFGSASGLAFFVATIKNAYWMHPIFTTILLGEAAVFCGWPLWKKGLPASTQAAFFDGSVVVFLCTLAQALFSRDGHFYRYEAWLVVLFCLHFGLFFTILLQKIGDLDEKRTRLAHRARLIFIGLAICFPLILRANFGIIGTAVAMRNLRENHIRMAEFLNRFCPKDVVAINDIGAVSFFSTNKLIDLEGLATTDILKERPKRNAAVLADFLKKRGVQIGLLNESWYVGLTPKTWVKVGEWAIPENLTAGDETLQFFAADSARAVSLRQQLLDFQALSSDGVTLRLF